MAELSIETIAIVLLFLVVAAAAIIFLFSVYSTSTGQSESIADMSENLIEEGASELKNSEPLHYWSEDINTDYTF